MRIWFLVRIVRIAVGALQAIQLTVIRGQSARRHDGDRGYMLWLCLCAQSGDENVFVPGWVLDALPLEGEVGSLTQFNVGYGLVLAYMYRSKGLDIQLCHPDHSYSHCRKTTTIDRCYVGPVAPRHHAGIFDFDSCRTMLQVCHL